MSRAYSPNYLNIGVLALLHLMALGGVFYIVGYGVTGGDVAFAVVTYFLGGFGITALYHRSWTHNAVEFAKPLEIMLAVGSVFVLQSPGTLWVANHIRHHQHTDHEDDPYNIQKGFWWAHQNWVFFHRGKELPRLPQRLMSNPVFVGQARWYFPLSFALNIVLPAYISWFSGGQWWGGILLSALRLLIFNHMIFAVNSVCHLWGTQKFSTRDSSRDVWWYPFTLGEQYHNFHHTFPRDYRNGIRWYDFDPTKWLIWFSYKLGLASLPFQTPEEKVREAVTETASLRLAPGRRQL